MIRSNVSLATATVGSILIESYSDDEEQSQSKCHQPISKPKTLRYIDW
jgi:hypothetical protein